MEFLQYDIRVAVLIAVFYMFYRLLLSRDSLHQLNRFVLLGTAVASFVLPLCVVTIHRTEWISAAPEMPAAVSAAATPAAAVAVSLVVSARTVTDYKVAEPAASPASALSKGGGNSQAGSGAPNQLNGEGSPTSLPLEAKGLGGVLAPADSATLSKALVMVDGKKTSYSVLGDLDPNDIENVTVLKDKDALTKYGVKTAVVVVKTKSQASAPAAGGKVYETADEPPVFKGGEAALMQYLAQNVRYPKVAQEWGVMGRVMVSFIVNADGSLSDIHVANNQTTAKTAADVDVVGYGGNGSGDVDAEVRKKGEADGRTALEAEAVRVVSSMPAWQPGKQDGKAVRVHCNIPLTFRLE